jgi:hypothetical protein
MSTVPSFFEMAVVKYPNPWLTTSYITTSWDSQNNYPNMLTLYRRNITILINE